MDKIISWFENFNDGTMRPSPGKLLFDALGLFLSLKVPVPFHCNPIDKSSS